MIDIPELVFLIKISISSVVANKEATEAMVPGG